MLRPLFLERLITAISEKPAARLIEANLFCDVFFYFFRVLAKRSPVVHQRDSLR